LRKVATLASLEDLGKVVSTDVLIIGGGIAGLPAAIKVKEASPELDVLIVDKATIGWSGAAPKGGGVFWVIAPEDDLNIFIEAHLRQIGMYLEDQELLFEFARESYGAVEQLAAWGVNVPKHTDGKLATYHILDSRWSHASADMDMLLSLRARARKLGAKMLNKVQVVDLLKQGDRVVGAVGFNLIDNSFYIFQAKATILASGGCHYRMERMWAAGCGEGIAAAYRAGAEMRNAEFGNLHIFVLKDTGFEPRLPKVQDYLVNSAGEDISERYNLRGEPLDVMSIVPLVSVDKEVAEGRGPIYLDMTKVKPPPKMPGGINWDRPKFDSWRKRSEKLQKYMPPASQKPELSSSCGGALSPIKVDHDMRTSLPGLWAIGDTSYMGSSLAGAIPAPPGGVRGSGLMNAVLGALKAGPTAARFSAEAAPPKVSYSEVKQLKEETFAPMQRNNGVMTTDVLYALQDIVHPLKYTIRRSKDRLEEAISKLEEIQQKLPELAAKDGHGLLGCHEVKSLTVCAEITFRAALARTESRGWHYREDYPKRDDKNWLKWVIVTQKDGKATISTEPVPVGKYKFKP
jgi:succinate dehydrogenase / fumarate reductase flavoprotein subunit